MWGSNKFSWEFVVDIPSGEYDLAGNPIRKQKRVSGYKKESEAKKAEFEFLKQLDSGQINLDTKALFKELAQPFLEYIEKSPKYEKGTVSNYKGYYNNHFGPLYNIKAQKINDEVLKNWTDYLIEKGCSPYLINNCRKLGMAIFTYHKKIFKYNPFRDMERQPEIRKLRNRLNEDRLKEMQVICKKNLPRFYCIFCLSFLSGLRLGEYTALDKEDIKQARCEIFVNKQYTRRELKNRNKTEKSTRIARYPEQLNEVINWHIRKFGIFSGLMFRGKDGKPVSPNWVSAQFKTLLKLCGYPENYMRVHDLRGEFVDLLHQEGTPTVVISRLLGHARTSTTNDVYSSILEETNTTAMVKLGAKIF